MAETAPTFSEEQVLAFLAEAADEVVSGEAISDKLGLTRAAVWKHVESLRGQGYRIDAVASRGYRLVSIPDRLRALELRPLLNTHDVGQVLHCHEELGSTNDEAKRLADDDAGHGEVVVAERQTEGRGRRGRAWISPARRNVAFSVILRPEELPPARAPELTLVAAVALCDALRHSGVAAGIKWPNDVLVGGRKIAGILTEMSAEADLVHWVVIGVGVNVNARLEDFPEELRDQATSLLIERDHPSPRALFLAACLTSLETWYDRHAEGGFAPIRQAWRERSVTLGQQVSVTTDGAPTVGLAEDIDDTGALLLRTPAGLTRITSGDVAMLRAAPR
jgi:BirA family biotin operon repressor/biotin-[acetyl-CoA-carboxylase] ligase